MKLIFLLTTILLSLQMNAQSVREMHENAKLFMKQGDHSNAILILNRALTIEPGNGALSKDLALAHYFRNEHTRALEVIKNVVEKDDADDQSYIIAGNIYRALNQPKDAEKLYRKAIKKFPTSGPLYNDLGETLWGMKDLDAIKQWEKGIETDPSYSKNYYNAARYYYLSTNKVWSLIYGEIFVNMEPQGSKTPEMKEILLESYKKFFSSPNMEIPKDARKFEREFIETLNRQAALASRGISAETLTMIRARFILEWFGQKNPQPSRLFSHHRQLMQEGMFNAYNQWLFGSVQNLSYFQNWINANSEEYNAFTSFIGSRIFRIPEGEYYK